MEGLLDCFPSVWKRPGYLNVQVFIRFIEFSALKLMSPHLYKIWELGFLNKYSV